jgi:hypothetical protein
VVDLSQRQEVRRRLGESLPKQNVRPFLRTAAENQKIYSRTEFGLAAKR